MNDLGRCCACEGTLNVTNVVMIDKRGPTPGMGWGCVQCHIPMDGAVAVVCDACIDDDAPLRFVCDGYPGADKRVPIDTVTEPFGHNLALHPEAMA